jgi:DNA-binding MurR/RpiR family transcriptional regulator
MTKGSGSGVPKTGAAGADDFSARLARDKQRLTPAMRRVADFIDQNRTDVLLCSALELARLTHASDATIIRTAQALGFDGLDSLRASLAASLGATPSSVERELISSLEIVGKDVDLAISRVLDSQEQALRTLQKKKVASLISSAVQTLARAKRIAVFGMGPTGYIAGYFCERLRRSGRRQILLNQSGGRLADQLLDLEPGDALLMLAYGKPYSEAAATIAEAQRLKMPIVLVSDSLDDSLSRYADVIVPAPRSNRAQVSLHGATVACLEAIAFGLAATDPERAARSVQRLSMLRNRIANG